MAKRKINELPAITAGEIADDAQFWVGADVVDLGLSFKINGSQLKSYLGGPGINTATAAPTAAPSSWASTAQRVTLIRNSDTKGTKELLGFTSDAGFHVAGGRSLPINDNPTGIGTDPENPTLAEFVVEFLAQGLALPIAGDVIVYTSPTKTYQYDVLFNVAETSLVILRRTVPSMGGGGGGGGYEEVANKGARTAPSTVSAGYRSFVSSNQATYVSNGTVYRIESASTSGTTADRNNISEHENGQVFFDTDLLAIFIWNTSLVSWVEISA